MTDRLDPATRHILIVDDDQLTAAALMRTLRADDLGILSVIEGLQALFELRARNYDLVFLEIGLIDGSGMAVLDEISSSVPSTCLVVMSASLPEEEVQSAILENNHYFLPKPFEALQVRTLVRRILGETPARGTGEVCTVKNAGERRQWPRQLHEGSVICQPDSGEDDTNFSAGFRAEIVDLGPEGVGIRTDLPVPPGQVILFKGEAAVWQGVIRWSLVFGDRYRAGVQFV